MQLYPGKYCCRSVWFWLNSVPMSVAELLQVRGLGWL